MATFTLSTGTPQDAPTVLGRLETFATNVDNDEDQRVAYEVANVIKDLVRSRFHALGLSAEYDVVCTVTDTVVDVVVTGSTP